MPAGRQGAVVAAINGELIGMLATRPCSVEDLTSWSQNFKLAHSLPDNELRLTAQHALIDACILHPVLATQAGTVLAGASQVL